MRSSILIGTLILAVSLSVLLSPLAKADTTGVWQVGEVNDYGQGEVYVVVAIVVGQEMSATIQVNSVSNTYHVHDIVGTHWQITAIDLSGVSVARYTGGLGENISPQPSPSWNGGTDNTIILQSGDVVWVTQGTSIVGAFGVSFMTALNPTFAFWSAYRVPSEISVPIPDDLVSLGVGSEYSPDAISGITIHMETETAASVELRITSSSTVTLAKIVSRLGETSYTDLINQAIHDALAQYPTSSHDNQPTIIVEYPDNSLPIPVILVIVFVGLIVGIYFVIKIGQGVPT